MALDLTPGAELPPFVRAADLAAWNRYAAVNDEFVPLHMDDEAGRAAGFPSAIGMGNLATAYLHNLVRDWLRGQGRLTSLSIQFRQPATRNRTVTAAGRIVSAAPSAEGSTVELELWVADDTGAVLASGAATALVRA